MARDILDSCVWAGDQGPQSFTGGQIFDAAGFNVIVREDYCPGSRLKLREEQVFEALNAAPEKRNEEQAPRTDLQLPTAPISALEKRDVVSKALALISYLQPKSIDSVY